jgi:hypothetical protein
MAGQPRQPRFKCRAPRNKDGRACQRGVRWHGQRCYQHPGRPEVSADGCLPEYIQRAPSRTRARSSKRAGSGAARPDGSGTRDGGSAATAQPSFEIPAKTQEVLIAEAVNYFEASVSRGAIDAAASRAAQYVGDSIWSQLKTDRWGRNCKGLARLARDALEGKDWFHGQVAKWAIVPLELMGTLV